MRFGTPIQQISAVLVPPDKIAGEIFAKCPPGRSFSQLASVFQPGFFELTGAVTDAELTSRQRDTLTPLVDTFVSSIERDDDPTAFFATKRSDVGAQFFVEHYLTSKLPAAQLAKTG